MSEPADGPHTERDGTTGPTAREETLAFVSERDATGETAELFADIRDTLGLPVVNLIWRHFATVDGGLPWAWGALRPLYACGAVEAAAARLVTRLELPALAPIPACVLRGAGVTDADTPVVAAILDSYNRGNALNACALAALLAEAGEGGEGDVPESGGRDTHLPKPAVTVPPMPDLAELAPPVRDLVWQVNGLGQAGGDAVLASLYKHLGPWPGFLSLTWALLAPLDRDGRLANAVARAGAAARQEGAALARLADAPPPSPAADPVRAAAAHFVDRVIGRMVPVAQMLRRAMG